MKCPLCGKDMVQKSVNIMVVGICEQCPGIWFSPGDMEEILDSKASISHLVQLPEEISDEKSRKEDIHCPFCRGEVRLTRMKTHVTSRIEIDACTVCYGKWITGEGLRNMIDFCKPKGIKALMLKLFSQKTQRQRKNSK